MQFFHSGLDFFLFPSGAWDVGAQASCLRFERLHARTAFQLQKRCKRYIRLQGGHDAHPPNMLNSYDYIYLFPRGVL